jgi:hypothetical protein
MQEQSPMIAWYPRNLEDEADSLLQEGNFSAAEVKLRESIKESIDPTHFSHAAFKLLTLPLYELAYSGPTEERVKASNDVYGLVMAQLMEEELTAYATQEKLKSVRRGRISELAFFCLLIREGIENDISAVPVPASRSDDRLSQIDFYLSPVGTGRTNDGWQVQVKTTISEVDREDFQNRSTILIGMKDIDPEITKPLLPGSLPSSMVREVDGRADDRDQRNLTNATATLYEKITNNPEVRQSGIERQLTLRELAESSH